LAGLAALASLTVVSFVGGVHVDGMQHRLIAFGGCAGFALSGMIAARSTSEELATVVSRRGGPAVGGVVRLLTTVTGYLVVLFTLLTLPGPAQRSRQGRRA
jgi:hypothetical protein